MSRRNIKRYTKEQLEQMIVDGQDRTDWARVDALTDEEIERAVAEDPDAELLDDEFFRNADLVMPDGTVRKPITIRLDSEVLEFFPSLGQGYESRINEVLRDYMESERLKAAKTHAPRTASTRSRSESRA